MEQTLKLEDLLKIVPATGTFDSAGRLCIPSNIRRALGVKAGQTFEIFQTENGGIFCRPIEKGGSKDNDVNTYSG